MADKIKLVRGDTRPQVKTVITEEGTTEPMDLTGATVRLLFTPAGTKTIQATLIGTLLAGIELEDGSVNSAPPYDVPGSGGRVMFPWGSSDLDCEAGEYEGEVKITFADATQHTVYSLLKFTLRDNKGD